MPEDPEDADALARVADRLFKAFAGLDRETVEGAVGTAYAELRYARVRTYLPILVERRARDLLAAAGDDTSPGGEGDTEPGGR
ncbi:three-helix bundle dimerization domain-containing protein [Streptomyces sp. NPDC093801]|uniref:three-helix bundle dimerization domain-containing protein n=1 Tax=Streptomyces sp. NPDC093801 TaxID=3155203 RepID=UPI00344F1BCC